MSPVLVTRAVLVEVGLMKRVFDWLALIVPRLVLLRIIEPLPIFPAPEMLMLLVRTSVPEPDAPKMKFWELFDRVSVPEPLSVTLPLIFNSVAFPPQARLMFP